MSKSVRHVSGPVAIDQGAGCPGDIIKGQGGCYSLARTRRNPVSRVRKRRLGDRPPTVTWLSS